MKRQHKHIVTILVNYCGAQDTIACLKSLLKNEQEPPFVIVVDNSDEPQEELNDITSFYPETHLIATRKNEGFGKANNVGIQWAFDHLEFDYLLLLNNDTEIAPNAVSNLVHAFETNPKTGIATSKIMYHSNREIVWYGGAWFNKRRGWPIVTDVNEKATENGANNPRFVDFASGCVMLFDRKCIDQIKGFTTDFFMYCEDLELCLRAQKLGFKIYYEPKSIVYHKVQGSQSEKSEKKYLHPSNPNANFLFYHMRSNQYLTMKEHLSFGDFLLFNVDFFLRNSYFTMRMLFRGKFGFIGTVFKTKWRILKHLFKKLNYE